ncbi:hypothetical protein [Mycetocola sp. 2940]|uniref:hypothetical protein n=1 Tax=Mycetocola sp. 2940 TaxID=3156452 RepID=UPI003399A83D
MSSENSDAAPPPHPPHMFSRATLLGVVCFAVGLLAVAGGVVLTATGLVTASPVNILLGLLVALVGIGINITGLVLIYRGVTRPGQETGIRNRNP